MKNKKAKDVEPVVEEIVETVENVEEVVTEEVVAEVAVEELVTEPEVEASVEEPVTEPEVEVNNIPNPTDFVEGVVVKCTKLNVREEPNKDANVVKMLDRRASVMIDLNKSTDDFYFVHTLDFEGYCVKDFLEIK